MGANFGIGSKFMSNGDVIFNGEIHHVKEHERTVLVSDEAYIIFDHPVSLVRHFIPTDNKWIDNVVLVDNV